ncbi:hypothetical protein SCP_0801030 [Sparassis crispa]|uniref:Uncharacterized protein n=1 Tax=Sparassis crispa TaxID=139825 RepID=A0A401GTQ3_9APHY|nr:hypothetical protein SCP_0801030 [Sparassis crispa]GBE85586.1 hypothetical protein SCP_0801030 [Sparassis crispa]
MPPTSVKKPRSGRRLGANGAEGVARESAQVRHNLAEPARSIVSVATLAEPEAVDDGLEDWEDDVSPLQGRGNRTPWTPSRPPKLPSLSTVARKPLARSAVPLPERRSTFGPRGYQLKVFGKDDLPGASQETGRLDVIKTRGATSSAANALPLAGSVGARTSETPAPIPSSVYVLISKQDHKRKRVSALQIPSVAGHTSENLISSSVTAHTAAESHIQPDSSADAGVHTRSNGLMEAINSRAVADTGKQQTSVAAITASEIPSAQQDRTLVAPIAVKKRRGRPRKTDTLIPSPSVVKRPRGRPRESAPAALPAPALASQDQRSLLSPPTSISIAAITGTAAVTSPQKRLCSHISCQNALLPFAEYRFLLCEKCRERGRRNYHKGKKIFPERLGHIRAAGEVQGLSSEERTGKRRKTITSVLSDGNPANAASSENNLGRQDKRVLLSHSDTLPNRLEQEEEGYEKAKHEEEEEAVGNVEQPSNSAAPGSSKPAGPAKWWLDTVNLTWRRVSEPTSIPPTPPMRSLANHITASTEAHPCEFESLAELCLALTAAYSSATTLMTRRVSKSGILNFADGSQGDSNGLLQFYGTTTVIKDAQVIADEQYVRDLTEEIVYGSGIQLGVRMDDEYVTFMKRGKVSMVILLCECASSGPNGPGKGKLNKCGGHMGVSIEEEHPNTESEQETVLRIKVEMLH